MKSERALLAASRNEFRRWLKSNAPRAQITSELDVAVHAVGVKLNGTSLETIRQAPMVRHAELQGIFRSLAHDDPDLSLINANEAWTAVGGEANAGVGVKVAVIDSGIDATHPCFDDAGYAAQTQLGDTSLTNNKVIVAKVFHNQKKKLGLDASAVDSHGRHVAGTIACNAHTPAVIGGVDIPYDPSGVAPRALLGNYNVFPGEIGTARSEDILDALDEAYEDGFDIANMSLGGARNDGGGAFLLDNAIDNLDLANMVVAVAAGNEGPGYFTVHYPGAAPRALTAGASVVGHSIINLVTVDGTDYEAVVGDFGTITSDVTAPLAVVPDADSIYPHKLSLACDPPFEGLPAGTDLTGGIALLGRGDCDFTVKVRNAQNAGAVGVIMVDRVLPRRDVDGHPAPRPTWTAAQVRSAVVNTAQEGLLRHPETGDVTNDAQIVGAGLVDVAAAVDAVAGLDPVSTSFGNVSSGSGGSRSSSIVITNISSATKTFTVSVTDDSSDGVQFGTNGGSVTLAAGASATFKVSAAASKGATDGHKQAILRVSVGATEVAHAMLYVLIGEGERAPGRHMLPPPKA